MDRRHLLPDIGFARLACLCDVASGDFDAYPGFSPPMGSTQAHRALDDPDLALRLGHRCLCLFDALQMVPPGNVIPGNPACDRLARSGGLRSAAAGNLEIAPPWNPNADRIVCVTRNLALGNYLMFDHTMRWSASEKNYGDYCDVQ